MTESRTTESDHSYGHGTASVFLFVQENEIVSDKP